MYFWARMFDQLENFVDGIVISQLDIFLISFMTSRSIIQFLQNQAMAYASIYLYFYNQSQEKLLQLKQFQVAHILIVLFFMLIYHYLSYRLRKSWVHLEIAIKTELQYNLTF